MDYLFRLADGRRVALWSERNQIIRQLSGGGGNRSHITLRTDYLSDFSAASLEGKIYFTYQNTSRRVMLYLPDGEEDRLLFGESIESCRHSGLTLIGWQGKLYLFYIAWSPILEKYSLKVRKPLENSGDNGPAVYDGGELVLARDFEEPSGIKLIEEEEELLVMASGRKWKLTVSQDGTENWQEGDWIEREKTDRWLEAEREAEKLRIELENARNDLDAERLNTEKIRGQWAEESAEWEKQQEEWTEKETVWEKQQEEWTEKEIVWEKRQEEWTEKKTAWEKQQEEWTEKETAWEKQQREWVEKCRELEKNTEQYREEIERQAEENEKLKMSIRSAITQYNELAEVARQLQNEGKKWRDKYIQEVKKRKDRTASGKEKEIDE